jgi:hypothetical protein
MGDRDRQVSTLKTLGYCIRAYSPWFVAIERDRLGPAEADCLRLYIDGLAENVERLADIVREGTVTCGQVEAIITELYDAGFYPPKLAITAVSQAFADEN